MKRTHSKSGWLLLSSHVLPVAPMSPHHTLVLHTNRPTTHNLRLNLESYAGPHRIGRMLELSAQLRAEQSEALQRRMRPDPVDSLAMLLFAMSLGV